MEYETETYTRGHPFTNVQSNKYWSATTLAVASSDARLVNFGDGSVNIADKTLTWFVWCVRGGQGVDPQ